MINQRSIYNNEKQAEPESGVLSLFPLLLVGERNQHPMALSK